MPTETQSDESLIQAYLTGEHTAFDQIVNRYQERLIGYAHSRIHHYQDAEDAVQETWLDVWQNIRRFQTTRKFSSWLYKICRDKCYDRLRKKSRAVESLSSYDEPIPSDPEKLTKLDILQAVPLEKWADWIDARETRARILAVLNHRQYRLYDLVMVKGRPYEAIPQEEKLFRDMTPEQVREEFDRVLTIVWNQAEKEKEKWRGKIHRGDAENAEKI